MTRTTRTWASRAALVCTVLARVVLVGSLLRLASRLLGLGLPLERPGPATVAVLVLSWPVLLLLSAGLSGYAGARAQR